MSSSHHNYTATTPSSSSNIDCKNISSKNNRIVIRENGTRHAGCDESSGWIWYAARQLEAVLALELVSSALSAAVPAVPPPTGTASVSSDIAAAAAAASSSSEEEDHHHHPQPQQQSTRILELGSGTGWLSLHLAQRGAIVTATERTGAMALLTQNVMRNQEQIDRNIQTTTETTTTTETPTTDTQTLQVDVQELEWSSPQRLVGDSDWIVGTDLLYIKENYLPLLHTIRRHCSGSAGPHHCTTTSMCVLSWEERKPIEEATFVPLAQDNGFHIVSLLPLGINPATDNRLWILRMTYNHNNHNNHTTSNTDPS